MCILLYAYNIMYMFVHQFVSTLLSFSLGPCVRLTSQISGLSRYYKDVIKRVLGLKTNLQGGGIKYVAAVSKARLKWLKTQVKGETENTFHFR